MTSHASARLFDRYPSAAASALRGMRRVSNDAYVETMEAHLEMWGASIDKIRQRAEETSGEGRARCLAQVDAATTLKGAIALQLRELQTANDERIDELRSSIAQTWSEFTSEVCRK